MPKGHKYVVLSDQLQPHASPERSLQASVGVCHTCAKAYEIALFLAGITKPDKKYRKVLQETALCGVSTLRQAQGEAAATIILSKIY